MLKLPQYQCHKKVHAAKILAIEGNGDGTHSLLLAHVVGDEQYRFGIHVPASYMSQHAPEIGGYFVMYEDGYGYQSYSPAKQFEEDYTLINQQPSQGETQT